MAKVGPSFSGSEGEEGEYRGGLRREEGSRKRRRRRGGRKFCSSFVCFFAPSSSTHKVALARPSFLLLPYGGGDSPTGTELAKAVETKGLYHDLPTVKGRARESFLCRSSSPSLPLETHSKARKKRTERWRRNKQQTSFLSLLLLLSPLSIAPLPCERAKEGGRQKIGGNPPTHYLLFCATATKRVL